MEDAYNISRRPLTSGSVVGPTSANKGKRKHIRLGRVFTQSVMKESGASITSDAAGGRGTTSDGAATMYKVIDTSHLKSVAWTHFQKIDLGDRVFIVIIHMLLTLIEMIQILF